MKVCIFSDAQSVHLQRIVAGLVERGVGVHVVTHKPADLPGASVERFTVPRPSIRNLHRWRGRWWRYLQSFARRFDVVHVHFLADWGFTPELLAEGCFVATPWGSDVVPPPGEGDAPAALLESRVSLLRHAALVTAWGPSFARTVADFAGIDQAGIELLPLGVDLNLFRPQPSTHFDRHGYKQVGFFKGFREVYGATYLVRAMPFIVEAHPTVRFLMIGDGPQLDACKALCAQLEVEHHVQWVRRQPHANIPNHIALCDVTAVPSICESFGAAALESSAMGIPVVASDVGGLPDTVRHDETGLLVPPRKPAHLAEAVMELLENPERRFAMGEAGRRMVEREYEWGGILDKWVRTYETARDRVAAVV
ncbi:MAG: glycosyltransferase [Planctomycetes bacterium]|nr:glycosyltransferase [Planctomycetota bacterium]